MFNQTIVSLFRKTLFINCFKFSKHSHSHSHHIMKKFIQEFITFMKSNRESFLRSFNRENNSTTFTYDTFQDAYNYLQIDAKVRDFVIVKRRSKSRVSIEKIDKIVLVCDRNDIYKLKEYKRKRKINIIKCDCSWQIIVQHYKNIKKWNIIVNIERHNHDSIEAASHKAHRRNEMTKKILKQIEDFTHNDQ